jgi:hypothetical protein
MSGSPRTRWGLVLLAALIVSLILVAYPIYVIRPFRAQGPRELALALAISRFRPAATVISALVAVWAAFAYWRAHIRISGRILAVAGAVLACVLAGLARVNVYEQLMFHPDAHPEFGPASAAKLDRDDKLIVVNIGGRSRGYPIRTMGYHHVVNDVVGGTAIVATY